MNKITESVHISFADMAARWPSSHVAREKVGIFTGGAVEPKYMANLDGLGEGPEGAIKVGRKVVYPVANFIKWLEGRARPKNNHRGRIR